MIAILFGAVRIAAEMYICVWSGWPAEQKGFTLIFIDFPIFLLANFLGLGDLIAIPILGIAMYAGTGYLLGRLGVWGTTRIMKSSVPAKVALILAALHFLIVAVPLIVANGIWERVPYLLFVDFPLFVPANMVAADSLDGSPAFNYALFAFLGTVMYGGAGYLIGRMVVKGGK